MRTILTLVSLAVSIGACGAKHDTDSTTTATTTTSTTTATNTNTSTTATNNPALDVMKQWVEAYGKADWNKLKSLYAANAVVVAAGSPRQSKGPDDIVKFFSSFGDAFPDIKSWPTHSFAKGDTVASVAMVKGTNSKSMMGMTATNKQMSFMALQIAVVKHGKIIRQDLYADNFNFLAQLGAIVGQPFRPVWEGELPTHEIVISSGNATEKTNLATIGELLKHFNNHDANRAIAMYTPNAWLDDQSAPARVGGNGNILKEYKSLFTTFPDVTLKDAKSWAAGDYVITTYTFNGKNSGDAPGAKATNKTVDLPAASVFHLKHGKIANHIVFWDGAMFRMQLGKLNMGMPAQKHKH